MNTSILLSITADLTSVPKKSISSAVVCYYCDWCTFFSERMLGWIRKLRLFLFGTSRFYKLGAPITNLKAIQNKDLKWIKRPKVVFNVRV